MLDPHSLFLLIAAFVSVIGLILLVAVVKLNPSSRSSSPPSPSLPPQACRPTSHPLL